VVAKRPDQHPALLRVDRAGGRSLGQAAAASGRLPGGQGLRMQSPQQHPHCSHWLPERTRLPMSFKTCCAVPAKTNQDWLHVTCTSPCDNTCFVSGLGCRSVHPMQAAARYTMHMHDVHTTHRLDTTQSRSDHSKLDEGQAAMPPRPKRTPVIEFCRIIG
jgi:hypothetical protein